MRPRFVVATDERCTIPRGKTLYWTKTPKAAAYIVERVEHVAAGSRVMLQHETSTRKIDRPAKGDDVVFSVHHLNGAWWPHFAPTPPWTHVKSTPAPPPDVDEDGAWQ